jgi:hypothetical protein
MYVQGKKTTNYETRNSVAKKTEQVADKRTLSNIKKKITRFWKLELTRPCMFKPIDFGLVWFF